MCGYFARHKAVRYWVHNRKHNSFWLQLPHGKFYPDFVALLTDDRILMVEYKGEDRFDNPDNVVKCQIGELRSEASDGLCLFAMPTRGDFHAIDNILEGVGSGRRLPNRRRLAVARFANRVCLRSMRRGRTGGRCGSVPDPCAATGSAPSAVAAFETSEKWLLSYGIQKYRASR